MILPTSYLPNLSWWALALTSGEEVMVEYHENYPRQTYRNRCHIYSAAGLQALSIPVRKVTGNHTLVSDILIDYTPKWNQIHWKAILSAYRKTPYFQFYEDDLYEIFRKKVDRLVDWNEQLLLFCLRSLRLEHIRFIPTTDYIFDIKPVDYRYLISPKKDPGLLGYTRFPRYIQAFEHVSGFLPDMSILDLLANEGPMSLSYLLKMNEMNFTDAPGYQPGIQP